MPGSPGGWLGAEEVEGVFGLLRPAHSAAPVLASCYVQLLKLFLTLCDFYASLRLLFCVSLSFPLHNSPPSSAEVTVAAQRYFSVSTEFVSEVARRQQLHLPELAKWPQAKQELAEATKAVFKKHPADFSAAQAGRALLLGVEVAGFFVIGEMIGRRQIVGYAH